MGSIFSNQMRVIGLLSRSMPPTHTLLVKLHKSDVGNYSREQLEMMKAQVDIEEIKAKIQLNHAKAAEIFNNMEEKGSEEALIKLQMETAQAMASLENMRVKSALVMSEINRNAPEMDHLQSETILNLVMARSKAQGNA